MLTLTQPATAKQEYSTSAASAVSASSHACRARRSSPYLWDRPHLSHGPGSGSKLKSLPRKRPSRLRTLVNARSSSAPFPLNEILTLLARHLYLPRPRFVQLLQRRHPQTLPSPVPPQSPWSNIVFAASLPGLRPPRPTLNVRPWQPLRLRDL